MEERSPSQIILPGVNFTSEQLFFLAFAQVSDLFVFVTAILLINKTTVITWKISFFLLVFSNNICVDLLYAFGNCHRYLIDTEHGAEIIPNIYRRGFGNELHQTIMELDSVIKVSAHIFALSSLF